MDWLTFISNLIDSLAWPVAIALIVWWLKDHIGRLLRFTKKFRYGDLEIEFEQQLAALKQDVEHQRRIHPVEKRIEDTEVTDYLRSTAEVSPRAALVEAWVGLELTAVTSARMLDLIPSEKTAPFHKVIQALHRAEVIGSKDAEILNRLRTLRNEALHSPVFDISKKEVEEFIELTRDQADLIAGETFQKRGGCGH